MRPAFIDKPVGLKEVFCTAIGGNLATSAHNSQSLGNCRGSWEKCWTSKIGLRFRLWAVVSAPVNLIALFTDTDLGQTRPKIARTGGANNFRRATSVIPLEKSSSLSYSDQQVMTTWLLNAGLVAMNLVLALTDQGIGSNITGLTSKAKWSLGNRRNAFRPELLITEVDEKLEPTSYRLPGRWNYREKIERRKW